MNKVKPSLLEQQISRVNRRLMLQTLLNRLIWCWVGALAVALVWFLIEPILFETPPVWLRWTVGGSMLGLATLLSGLLTLLAAPSKLASALCLDERFGLKERATTSLTLTAEQRQSPAGQALLEDVNSHMNSLDIGSRFPIRMTWKAALVPAFAALLVLVAVFYQLPQLPAKSRPGDGRSQPPVNANEIAQKMKELQKKAPEKKNKEELKSEELKRIEADLEKIANKPRETREQLRDRLKEMTEVEDKIKNREKELASKSNAMKNQLKQLNQNTRQDGPAKELEKALSEGNTEKAKDEMEKLAKKIQDKELTEKEMEQLKKQLDKMQEKLDRAAQQKDKEEELNKLAKEGKLDAESLQRELDQLKEQNKDMQDLKDLAEALDQCKK